MAKKSAKGVQRPASLAEPAQMSSALSLERIRKPVSLEPLAKGASAPDWPRGETHHAHVPN